ncbi:MAG: Holliday junction resolvase RuvX [Anaerolineae bacterium]|jgi:putative Holliday junction resolvase|nr:Holliday junction resolvase RuvX [Anaerolineae bacterium]
MVIMALDVGERRIGIAISASGILASPHSVLQRKSKRDDFTRLSQLMAELEVERLVVGLPYSLSGHETVGPQARRIMRYAEALAKAVSIPVEYFDESYSTVDAEDILRLLDQKRVPLDAAAAAVILQNYLDSANDTPKFKNS